MSFFQTKVKVYLSDYLISFKKIFKCKKINFSVINFINRKYILIYVIFIKYFIKIIFRFTFKAQILKEKKNLIE